MDALCFNTGIHSIAAPPISASGNGEIRPSVSAAQPRNSPWGFTFRRPLRSLWSGGECRYEPAIASDDSVFAVEKEDKEEVDKSDDENWVFKILHVRSLWNNQGVNTEEEDDEEEEDEEKEEDCQECGCCDGDQCGEKIQFDKESFSKMLKKVPLAEARLYAKLSYLGTLAYSISLIKPGNLLRNHGLRFVTSSLEKREILALKAEKERLLEQLNSEVKLLEQLNEENAEADGEAQPAEEETEQVSNGRQISPAAAYQMAASAASYLHSHTKSILRFRSSMPEDSKEDVKRAIGRIDMVNKDMASLMATTDSVTAVVAAKEEVKQAVADDLNSVASSPCEWFVCDDDQCATRYFVIQGSESLSSWQANLLFEPVQFEGLDVLVHRGIYEAAKGIYEQMLPEIHSHLRTHGERATFGFTGHSLGGSLALLVNLMLLIRGGAPRSSLLPVVTFGAPSIMCGGDRLLRHLELPKNHLRSISMHRDIVPRAFSCNYPNHVAEFLKAVNRNFRNHPCLNKEKVLYSPMGEFLILQPDTKFSPSHDLLPSGSGLYILSCPVPDVADAEKQIRAAQSVFLNSPHPLEILSDRGAYGSEGTIHRDHDMNSYLKSVRSFIRQELTSIRKRRREQRKKIWWPLVSPHGINAGLIVSRHGNQHQFNFSGFVRTGKESWKRFTTLVASQHMQLLVVLLFPARLLVLGAFSLVNAH